MDEQQKKSILHDFFINGGQVKISIRSGSAITLPDCWYDVYSAEERAQKSECVLSFDRHHAALRFGSPLHVAEILNIPYRHVLELVRMQKLGTFKDGKYLKIYLPAVDHYIQQSLRELKCPIL